MLGHLVVWSYLGSILAISILLIIINVYGLSNYWFFLIIPIVTFVLGVSYRCFSGEKDESRLISQKEDGEKISLLTIQNEL